MGLGGALLGLCWGLVGALSGLCFAFRAFICKSLNPVVADFGLAATGFFSNTFFGAQKT